MNREQAKEERDVDLDDFEIVTWEDLLTAHLTNLSYPEFRWNVKQELLNNPLGIESHLHLVRIIAQNAPGMIILQSPWYLNKEIVRAVFRKLDYFRGFREVLMRWGAEYCGVHARDSFSAGAL